ncbi:hypothetical protein ACLOJK_025100 [Asimina triloba]
MPNLGSKVSNWRSNAKSFKVPNRGSKVVRGAKSHVQGFKVPNHRSMPRICSLRTLWVDMAGGMIELMAWLMGAAGQAGISIAKASLDLVDAEEDGS